MTTPEEDRDARAEALAETIVDELDSRLRATAETPATTTEESYVKEYVRDVVVTLVVAASIVLVFFIGMWAAVSVTRADRHQREVHAVECRHIEDEGMRTLCLTGNG